MTYIDNLGAVAAADVKALEQAQKSYGDSWKNRGGVGAYMMLARKMDRMEVQVKKHGYDVFAAVSEDDRAEGIIDDIRDLRRYLMLVEAELIERGVVRKEVEKGSPGTETRLVPRMVDDRQENLQLEPFSASY